MTCWNLLGQHMFSGCTSNHAYGDLSASKKRDEIRVNHFWPSVGLGHCGVVNDMMLKGNCIQTEAMLHVPCLAYQLCWGQAPLLRAQLFGKGEKDLGTWFCWWGNRTVCIAYQECSLLWRWALLQCSLKFMKAAAVALAWVASEHWPEPTQETAWMQSDLSHHHLPVSPIVA